MCTIEEKSEPFRGPKDEKGLAQGEGEGDRNMKSKHDMSS